jgi:hypothetical protein
MGNVRDRMTVTEGQDHSNTTDFTNRAWGSMVTTSLIQNQKGFAYAVRCSKCGISIRVSHEQLAQGFVPTCPRGAACGQIGDTTRRAVGSVEQYIPKPTASPRERAEIKQRAIETKQLEEESNESN